MAKREFQKINLRGIALYARIQSEMPAGDDKPEGDTIASMLIECPIETYKKLVKMGSKVKLKKAEELFGKEDDGFTHRPIPDSLKHLTGKTFIPLKREVKKTVRDGTQYDFKLPKVVDATRQPIDALVGNGSSVIARAEIIPYAAGKGYSAGIKLNLIAVQVLDLVEYVEKSKAADDDDFEGFENLAPERGSDDDFDSDDDLLDPAFG